MNAPITEDVAQQIQVLKPGQLLLLSIAIRTLGGSITMTTQELADAARAARPQIQVSECDGLIQLRLR